MESVLAAFAFVMFIVAQGLAIAVLQREHGDEAPAAMCRQGRGS